jgi:ElaB/YqjD/DUF883 family membrane-anchored ribosome-binding protein
MGFGLIGIGRNQADQAIQGFGEVSKLETARNEAEKTMKAQQESADAQMKGSMAATGAMIGTMIMPGIGTAVGAVGGLVLGSLF